MRRYVNVLAVAFFYIKLLLLVEIFIESSTTIRRTNLQDGTLRSALLRSVDTELDHTFSLR